MVPTILSILFHCFCVLQAISNLAANLIYQVLLYLKREYVGLEKYLIWYFMRRKISNFKK